MGSGVSTLGRTQTRPTRQRASYLVEGDVAAGDEVLVAERPDHDVTVRDVFRILSRDRNQAERLLTVPQMSEGLQTWAENWLRKEKGRQKDTPDPGCC